MRQRGWRVTEWGAAGLLVLGCSVSPPSWIGQVNAEGGTGFAGFSDWRVPTLAELRGIVDTSVTTCGSGTPCIDPIFGPTAASSYWSSTELATNVAHFVNFFNGTAANVDKNFFSFHVRAVRGGP